MSILVGRGEIFDKEVCKKQPTYKYKMTVPITDIVKELSDVLKKIGINVKRPIKKKLPICHPLWVRDQCINVDNKMYFFSDPLPSTSPSPLAIHTIPHRGKKTIVQSEVNIDGGDIIIDKKTIYVGINKRTDHSGLKWVKKMFPKYEIIPIKHRALHLDCCFSVMPNDHLLYSKKYIVSLPQKVRKRYVCKKVEDLISDSADPNLATNNLIVGNNVITTDQGKFKNVRRYIRELGFNVIELKFGTLWRQGGGPRCLTQWLKQSNKQMIY